MLVWHAYGERLDGLPDVSPDPENLDFFPCNPMHDLTFDEKRIFASWVDLGCLVNESGEGPGSSNAVWDVWDDQMRPTLVVQGIDTVNSTIPTGSITVSAYDLHSGLDDDSLKVDVESAGGHTPMISTALIVDGAIVSIDLSALAGIYSGEWSIVITVADNEVSTDVNNPFGNIARREFTVNL